MHTTPASFGVWQVVGRALENAHSALPLRAPCLGYGLDVKVQFENPLLPVLFHVVSPLRCGLSMLPTFHLWTCLRHILANPAMAEAAAADIAPIGPLPADAGPGSLEHPSDF